MPGKWYVDGDNICVIDCDGVINIFPTSWEKDRKLKSIEEVLKEKQKQDTLKEHYLEKRIQKQKERSKLK